MQITVEWRKEFGRLRAYPVDRVGLRLADWSKRMIFSQKDIDMLRDLGFAVEETGMKFMKKEAKEE